MNLSRATSPSQQSRIVESWKRSAPRTPPAYPPTPKATEARTPTAVARTVTPLGVNGVRSSHRVIHLEHRRLKCRSTKPSRPPLSERINVCSASAGPDIPSAQTSWYQSDPNGSTRPCPCRIARSSAACTGYGLSWGVAHPETVKPSGITARSTSRVGITGVSSVSTTPPSAEDGSKTAESPGSRDRPSGFDDPVLSPVEGFRASRDCGCGMSRTTTSGSPFPASCRTRATRLAGKTAPVPTTKYDAPKRPGKISHARGSPGENSSTGSHRTDARMRPSACN